MATKFELKEELYYGGCLGKMLSLLGKGWERMFIINCENPNEKNPAEWVRLYEVCERLVLLNKSKKCFGIENKGGLTSRS